MTRPTAPIGHIVVVVNDLDPHGSQRVVVALVGGLLRQGRAVTVVTLEPPSPAELPLPDGARRVSMQRPAIGGAAAYFAKILGVARTIRRLRPDLVISHMLLSNVTVLAAARLLRLPPRILVAEHTSVRNLRNERSPRALEALARRLYPRAHRVLGVSPGVVDEVRNFYRLSPDRVVCVWNPVDVARIRTDAVPDPQHPWLPSRPKRTTVVCVGALRRVKGQDVLLRSLQHLPAVDLICVGDGPLLDEYRELARDLGIAERVDFVGYRADAAALISRADALVVPSRWEGFGLVAVEAAAVGVPVIASDVLGLGSLVPDKVPGLLVPPEQPGALADALRLLVDGGLVVGTADLAEFAPDATANRYLAAAL